MRCSYKIAYFNCKIDARKIIIIECGFICVMVIATGVFPQMSI